MDNNKKTHDRRQQGVTLSVVCENNGEMLRIGEHRNLRKFVFLLLGYNAFYYFILH